MLLEKTRVHEEGARIIVMAAAVARTEMDFARVLDNVGVGHGRALGVGFFVVVGVSVTGQHGGVRLVVERTLDDEARVRRVERWLQILDQVEL